MVNGSVFKVVVVLVLTLCGIVIKINLPLFVGLNSLSKEMIRVFPKIRVRVAIFWDRLLYTLLVYFFVE